MSYSEKITQFERVIEYCVETAAYDTAVNRLYYIAFLMLQSRILPTDGGLSHGRIIRRYYGYLKLHNISIGVDDSSILETNLALLYNNRVQADYHYTKVTKQNVTECTNALKDIQEVIWKMESLK